MTTTAAPAKLRRVDLVAYVASKLREASHSVREYTDLLRRNPGRSVIKTDLDAWKREERFLEALAAEIGAPPPVDGPRRRIMWHYNKGREDWGPLNEMLVHDGDTIHVALGGVYVSCASRSERLNNPDLPRMVMIADAVSVTTDGDGAVHIR